MAPPAEMTDEEQIRVAYNLLDQIDQATKELRMTLKKKGNGDEKENPGVVHGREGR